MHTYKEITFQPSSMTGTQALSRIVDGIGFRYYWGTQNLSESDLAFDPQNGGRNMFQTFEHIHYMAEFVRNILSDAVTKFPEEPSGMEFPQLKQKTLQKFDEIKTLLQSLDDKDIQSKQINAEVNGDPMNFDIWKLLSGPIVDLAYHLGQVISFRRSNGNPIDPGVQPFLGIRME